MLTFRKYALLILGVLLVCAAIIGTAVSSRAATPYGGCDEAARYPHSAGAQDCRDQGWTISRRLVVNSHGVVEHSTLPHCAYEDGGENQPCSWNFDSTDGNGRGLAYWIDRNDGTHYVWAHNPTTKVEPRWQWVSHRDAVAMASTGHRTVRAWQQCVVRFGDDFTQTKCADGYRYADNS